jgi:hypothetical protein
VSGSGTAIGTWWRSRWMSDSGEARDGARQSATVGAPGCPTGGARRVGWLWEQAERRARRGGSNGGGGARCSRERRDDIFYSLLGVVRRFVHTSWRQRGHGMGHGMFTGVATCERAAVQWGMAVRASDEWESSMWHRLEDLLASRIGKLGAAHGPLVAGQPQRARTAADDVACRR